MRNQYSFASLLFCASALLCSAATNAGVATVHQHCNYSGWSASLNVGVYTLSQLRTLGFVNDDASSIQVSAGYEVVLYQHNNRLGSSITKNSSDNCFVDDRFNDLASSVVVRAISSAKSSSRSSSSASSKPGSSSKASMSAKSSSAPNISSVKSSSSKNSSSKISSSVMSSAIANTSSSSYSSFATAWWQPTPKTTWQWQLTGNINLNYNVAVYDLDLFDTSSNTIAQLHAGGKKVICYFSAGSYEEWRPDAAQFATSALGNALDGWPGERWLDIRATNVRTIMQKRLDLAKSKGCDAVEPDNIDGYTNKPGFPLTASHQLNYNRFLAAEAHARQLAIGLKNDLDQVSALVDDFDFAVNEQCFEYNECNMLYPFIQQNKAVFNAEYSQHLVDDGGSRAALCVNANALQFSTLILPLDLNDQFRFTCLTE